MARQILPLVGAVIGGIYGGPAGAQAGFAIGSFIGNAVDPLVLKGPSLGDGQVQTSKEGVVRPIIFGTACCSGNIIATGPLIKKTEEQGGGKGGPVTEVEKFYRTFAIRICEGPIQGVIRIWEDETLKLDLRGEGSQVSAAENNKFSNMFVVYDGAETQMPDSALESIFGVGNTPAYRGSAYIVFENYDLTNRYGSVPNFRFEVTVSDTATSPGFFAGITFEGKPGTYTALQAGVTQGRSMYSDCVAITQDQKFIFTGIINVNPMQEGIQVLKRNSETLLYEEIQLLTEHNAAANGFIISNDQRFLYTYISKRTGGGNDPTGSYIVSFLITENGLVENDKMFVDRQAQGSFGFRISTNREENKIAIKTTSSGVYPNTSRGLDIVYYNKGTGRFTQLIRKSDAEFPNNNQAAQANYTRFIPGTDLILISNLNDAYVYNSTTFELVDSKVFGTYNGNNEPPMIWQDQLGITHVLVMSGNINTALRNYHFTIDLAGMISDATNEYAPLTDQQLLGTNTYCATDTNNCEFIFVGHVGGQTSASNSYFWYKKNSSNQFDFIQKKSPLQAHDELNSIYYPTPQSPIFTGNTNTILVTGQYYLSNIIKDLAERCNLDLSHINTTSIDDIPVRGFVLAQQFTAKSAIESLQQCFFFDPAEYDDRINFVKRGNDVEQIFVENDFVEDSVEANRKSTIEYPKKLNLIYQNAKIGYDTAKAEARRNSPNFQVSGEKTIELPVVFVEDEAAQVADKQMKVAWSEASGEYKFVLPTQYDYLTPADVFGVYINNNSQRMRIETVERADGQLNVVAKIDRQSAYTSNVTAMPLPAPTPPPPTITGQTVFEYLNIPALLDSNDVLGYYVAGSGQTEAWYGAVVQRKHQNIDEDFQTVDTIVGLNLVGHILNNITDSSEHYSDTTNVIHVQMYNAQGQFESIEQETLLRENNAIAIPRADGTAEIIQFRDVESLGNGEFKLSYLLRGRLNTVTSAHTTGTNLVWLKSAHLIVTDAMEIGTTFEHRPVSYGQSPEDAITYVNSFEVPYIQLEFPVDLVRGTRSGTTLNVEWSPRERFGSDVNPVRSVNWTGYEVVVSNGVDNQSFFVDVPVLNDTMLFNEEVTVTVYQLNRFTGRGPGVTITIE